MKLAAIAIAFFLVTATIEAHSVLLHWEYGTVPPGTVVTFNVYRNSYRIATGVPRHKYKDGHPKIGKDHYWVTAVVAGVESNPSETVYVTVPQ